MIKNLKELQDLLENGDNQTIYYKTDNDDFIETIMIGHKVNTGWTGSTETIRLLIKDGIDYVPVYTMGSTTAVYNMTSNYYSSEIEIKLPSDRLFFDPKQSIDPNDLLKSLLK